MAMCSDGIKFKVKLFKQNNKSWSWVWLPTPIILAAGNLGHKNHDFSSSSGYTIKSCLNKKEYFLWLKIKAGAGEIDGSDVKSSDFSSRGPRVNLSTHVSTYNHL